MNLMPIQKTVNSSQLIVHRFIQKTVHREPSTVNRKSNGFTLIELLIVIFIIAILVSFTTVNFTNAQKKGRDGKRKADLKAVQQALEIYYQNNGKYPPYVIIAGFPVISCDGITGIAWGGNFTCNGITYMNPLPKEQTQSINYYYNTLGPGRIINLNYYQLFARLENSNDPDYNNFSAICNYDGVSTSSIFNYCVSNP